VAAAAPGGVAAAELARAEGAAVIVPAGAAGRLADALMTLRADPARRVAMGLAGLAHAQSQLSLPRALARFDAILDATLTAPPAALPVG
jgi:glycosyltransferase involved in cell wall biosynthesis